MIYYRVHEEDVSKIEEKILKVEESISKVEESISKVDENILEVEEKISKIEGSERLLELLLSLRDEKKILRDEKKILLELLLSLRDEKKHHLATETINVTVTIDDIQLEQPYSKEFTIGKLAEKFSKSMVFVDDGVVGEYDDRLVCKINGRICIKSTVEIPIYFENDFSPVYKTVEVMSTIKQVLETYFGGSIFAIDEKGVKIPMDCTIKSRGFHKSKGFSVKSWVVHIQTEYHTEDRDLSGFQNIRDVLKDLDGSVAFYRENQLSSIEPVLQFITRTPPNRSMFISVQPQTAHFYFEESISTAAKSRSGHAILKKTVEYEIYSHWLALRMYENWRNNEEVPAIVNNFQRILHCEYRDVLATHEAFYTSLLSHELDTFLSPLCCLHQMPIKHASKSKNQSPAIPDFYCTNFNESLPKLPLLAADFKVNEFETAKVQSFGYCQVLANHSLRPILAIPGNKDKFELYLCFVIGGNVSQLVTIKINEAGVLDSKAMGCFFSALKFGINSIIALDAVSFVVEPIRGLQLRYPLNSSKRVYLKDGKDGSTVYKLYNEKLLKPRIDVMKRISDDYFAMERVELSNDGNFVLYKSTYLPGKDRLELLDYKPIMEALDALHGSGFVHSDVREANLLFPKSGDAKLIDFDLANEVDTPYPLGYNKTKERHPDAQEGHGRWRIHDRYSIVTIIERTTFLTALTVDQKELLNKLKSTESNPPLMSLFTT